MDLENGANTGTVAWVVSAVPCGTGSSFQILPRTYVLGVEFLHF